jgi:hypothetical protein
MWKPECASWLWEPRLIDVSGASLIIGLETRRKVAGRLQVSRRDGRCVLIYEEPFRGNLAAHLLRSV